MPKKTVEEQIKHETDYVEFLRKRLMSENFKNNVSAEDFEATKKKYDKAKFKLKLLKNS